MHDGMLATYLREAAKKTYCLTRQKLETITKIDGATVKIDNS